MSQRRTPRQTPQPPPNGPPPAVTATQPLNQNVPQNIARKRGWYPRWWILSAVFCAILVSAIWLLQRYVCDIRHSNALICHVDSWNQWWQQELVVLTLWVLFALGWLGAYCFGVGTVEVNEDKRGVLANIVKKLSDHGPIRNLLFLYGLALLFALVILWFLKYPMQPVGFAFVCIIIFIANCCFLYGQEPASQLQWLRGYGVTMVITIAMMFLFGIFQPLLFIAECFVLIVGFLAFFLRSPTVVGLSSEQQLQKDIEETISPTTAFMDLIRGATAFFGRFRANPTSVQNTPNNQSNPTI